MFLELVLRAQNIGSDSDWTGGARSATVKAVLATHFGNVIMFPLLQISHDDENHHQKRVADSFDLIVKHTNDTIQSFNDCLLKWCKCWNNEIEIVDQSWRRLLSFL